MLTRLPFINLYHEMCSVIAPQYFDGGISVLESVCDNIDHWPALTAGDILKLPVLGQLYRTVVPRANSKTVAICAKNANAPDEPLYESVVPQPQLLSSVYETDIFCSLESVLPHVHLLWELVLTAEPIVVMGASPTDCSAMVASLASLIAPLNYCAESRPYFTIHDSEFKEFTQRPQGPPPIILGVTNPFFAKTLAHWPHTIRLPDHGRPTVQPSSKSSTQKLRKVRANATTSSARLLDLQPGVYTQYRQYLQKDQTVLKKIHVGIKTARPTSVQSALLRRHLLELTHSFMIPLERYMASLMPLQRDISPFKAAPTPNQFKQDDFLQTLETSGPQLTSTLRGDWEGLYKRFFRSSNFKGWYESRYAELQQTLQSLQLQALSEAVSF